MVSRSLRSSLKVPQLEVYFRQLSVYQFSYTFIPFQSTWYVTGAAEFGRSCGDTGRFWLYHTQSDWYLVKGWKWRTMAATAGMSWLILFLYVMNIIDFGNYDRFSYAMTVFYVLIDIVGRKHDWLGMLWDDRFSYVNWFNSTKWVPILPPFFEFPIMDCFIVCFVVKIHFQKK